MTTGTYLEKNTAGMYFLKITASYGAVMGGISEASVAQGVIDDRPCLLLTGDVRLENDGGFIQAALDLAMPDGTFDASAFAGVRLVVRSNDERYSVHLRTPKNVRPWQSY